MPNLGPALGLWLNLESTKTTQNKYARSDMYDDAIYQIVCVFQFIRWSGDFVCFASTFSFELLPVPRPRSLMLRKADDRDPRPTEHHKSVLATCVSAKCTPGVREDGTSLKLRKWRSLTRATPQSTITSPEMIETMKQRGSW
jgi:hypothetical protein